jgi:hypothetical protein
MHVQIGRAIFLVGASLVACSGSPNNDVQGSCEKYQTCVSPSDDSARTQTSCTCGTGGRCDNGRCVSCGCDDNQWCDQDNGKCNDYDHSKNACYGCPPMLV